MKIKIGDPMQGVVPRGSKPAQAKLPAQRVQTAEGETILVYKVDAASNTLTNDMLTVFRRAAVRGRRQTRDVRKKLGIAAE